MKLYIQGIDGRVGLRVYYAAIKTHEIQVLSIPTKYKVNSEVNANTRSSSGVVMKSSNGASEAELINQANVLIDFSSAEGIDNFIEMKDKVIILGVTGAKDPEDYKHKIYTLAKSNRVFYCANMSFGIHLVKKLMKEIQEFYKNLGIVNDILITDVHHKSKKDAPSGTAKMLGKLIEDQDRLTSSSVRFSDHIGSHSVTFDNPNEVIEIKHSSKSIDTYAKASLTIAEVLLDKPNGFYNMDKIIEMMIRR